MNYYFAAFNKYAVFKGHATRSEYWFFTLFNIFAVLGFGLIDKLMGTFNFDAGYGPLSAIYTLAMILPGLGVSIRRLHDTGRSGWWFVITIIPLSGFWYFCFLPCKIVIQIQTIMVNRQHGNTTSKIFLDNRSGMIELFFFENESEAIAAAHALEKLGRRARKLLAECIEHQIITRKSVSESARALENEGFIFIKESDDLFDKSVQMKPSLWGEEAMDVLEFLAQRVYPGTHSN